MTTRMIHAYSVMGGGEPGEVHGRHVVIPRLPFLFCLPIDKRRYLTLPDEQQSKLYYARMFGGEFRERERGEDHHGVAGPIKLLFLQGLAGTHVNWMPQLAYFSSKPEFDVVAMDNRGVGFSDTPAGRFRTSDFAQDVNLLITTLGWENVHLVGFSLGGMAALESILHSPRQFQSVSLLSTHAGGIIGTMLPPNGIPPFLGTFAALGSVGALDAGMELLHAKAFLDTDLVVVSAEIQAQADKAQVTGTITNRFQTAYELILQARKYVESETFPEIHVEGILKQVTAAATHYVNWDRLEHLKRSGVAVLVAGGHHDNLVNYLNQPMLAKVLGARKLVLKPDSGHAVNLHYSNELNLALEEHFTITKPVENPLEPMLPQTVHPWLAFLMAVFVVMRWTGKLTQWGLLKRTSLAMAMASGLILGFFLFLSENDALHQKMRCTSWKLADSVIEAAKDEVKNLILYPTPRNKELLIFLHAKKVLESEQDEEMRYARLVKLISPPQGLPHGNEVVSKFYTEARARLDIIVPIKQEDGEDGEDGDVAKEELPPGVLAYSEFLERYPFWKESFICQEIKDALVQRVQRSGLCYLHAPIVLQHYLVSKHLAKQGASLEEQKKTGMIDISKYIRGYFTGEQLYEHIFKDKGGSAPVVLNHILQRGAVVVSTELSILDEVRLKKFGPHLLCYFTAHDAFAYGDQLSYTDDDLTADGTPKGEPKGKHAMLIVGVRTTEDGAKMFMLQNWWVKKQFMEVSEKYIDACGAFPVFVKTEQTAIPTQFDTTLLMYAETAVDLEETYPREMA
ncbi:hypothetical protein BASA81_007942 [Batrachochytrium salamandrivorans]|nr:hypothetical protein BASA81_007942 [Batrachochytrium salamandrivorans]